MSYVASRAKRSPNPWWVAIVSGMASYIDASVIVGSGTALVLYQEPVGISGDQIGLLSGVLTFCIAIGALTGGRLGDVFGRRSVFIITMAMIAAGATLLVLSTSFVGLVIAMFLVGLGSGADLPVSLSTIAEAASDENRGKLIGFSQVLWLLGIAATTGIGILVGEMGLLGGQIIFGHVGTVALIVLLLRLTIPESAAWTSAEQEKKSGAHTLRAERSSIKDILTQRIYLVPFLGLLGFYALANLAANTTGQFGAFIGVNVVGLSVSFVSAITLLSIPLGVVFAFWFMRIVDTKYRMVYYIVGAILVVSAFAVPALFGLTTVTFIYSILMEVVGMAFAFEAIMKVWTQESFPTLLRSSAQGAILAVARILAAVLAVATPALLDNPQLMYGLIAGVAAVGLFIGWATFRKPRFNTFTLEDKDLAQAREELRAAGLLTDQGDVH
ncbi:MFS transporter [Kocuria sp. U4B]